MELILGKWIGKWIVIDFIYDNEIVGDFVPVYFSNKLQLVGGLNNGYWL